jgi:hypothetical protein
MTRRGKAPKPLLQIGVQHLGWSGGLLIEVGFFVPVGFALLAVSR